MGKVHYKVILSVVIGRLVVLCLSDRAEGLGKRPLSVRSIRLSLVCLRGTLITLVEERDWHVILSPHTLRVRGFEFCWQASTLHIRAPRFSQLQPPLSLCAAVQRAWLANGGFGVAASLVTLPPSPSGFG